jgi:hypothetical protein
MNKYERWYSAITNRAKTRTLDGYKERHHVIPHSLGGSDDSNNLVDLTAREHFICHWLLTKMHTGEARGKMINALYMMRGQSTHQKRYESKITGRIYENLREEYSQYISKMNKGRIQPPEEKARQQAAQIGRKRDPFSEEWKENLSKNHKSKKGYDCKLSEETRKKISEKLKGSKQSEEAKLRRKGTNLGSKRARLTCPHCSKNASVNTYPRWHGDNCKSINNIVHS